MNLRAIVELEVDADDWVAWAFREEMPAELIAFIRYRPHLLHVAYVDSHVTHHHDLTPHDFHLEAQGGGGSDYRSGFTHLKDNQINPACILYFTDGYYDSFPDSCDYPTLWIVTERERFIPPFREVIHMSCEER